MEKRLWGLKIFKFVLWLGFIGMLMLLIWLFSDCTPQKAVVEESQEEMIQSCP